MTAVEDKLKNLETQFATITRMEQAEPNEVASTDSSARALEEQRLSCELRQYIKNSLQNIGMLAAFMTALAAVVYVDYPGDMVCFGEAALKYQLTLAWLSLAFFFLATIMTVLLLADMDGVPDSILLMHLFHTKWLHSVPPVCVGVGTFLMAFAYGIDIGERLGCAWTLFGMIMAPTFPLMCFCILFYMRYKRRQLTKHLSESDSHIRLGLAIMTPWADRIPWHIKTMGKAEKAVATKEKNEARGTRPGDKSSSKSGGNAVKPIASSKTGGSASKSNASSKPKAGKPGASKSDGSKPVLW